MAKRKDTWVAKDGEEFGTEAEALIHEVLLADQAEINLFLDSAHYSEKHTSYLRRVLGEWQRHQRTLEFNNAPEAGNEIQHPFTPTSSAKSLFDEDSQSNVAGSSGLLLRRNERDSVGRAQIPGDDVGILPTSSEDLYFE